MRALFVLFPLLLLSLAGCAGSAGESAPLAAQASGATGAATRTAAAASAIARRTATRAPTHTRTVATATRQPSATSAPPTATSQPSATSATPTATAAAPPLVYVPGVFPQPITDRVLGGGMQINALAWDDSDNPIASDPLILRAVGYAPNAFAADGSPVVLPDGTGLAGVTVTFDIVGPLGDNVFSHTERTAPYCLFGGPNELPCQPLWRFAAQGCRWPVSDMSGPSSTPVQAGFHSVTISFVGADGTLLDQWFSGFQLELGAPCG